MEVKMLRISMTKTLLIGMMTLLSAGTALTQTPVGTQTPEGVSSAASAYLLAGDDVLSINVVNFPNLSLPQATVPPDGKLAVQLLEPFSVLGKTTTEVAQILTEKWKRYVRNPSVSVSLIQKRKENVLVYGFVLRPGTADYKPPMRLLEAVAQVGGPLPTADLNHVTLTRKAGGKETLDLSHPESRSATINDVALNPGDVVYIPERLTQISVVGEVLRPGSVDYKDGLNVEDVVVASGGLKETADLASATLLHDGKERKLDLDALYKHGDEQYNVKLAPGDRLLIPEMRNRTFVIGAVGHPGWYAFKPGDRIMDALNGMGGPTADANLKSVSLLHIAKDKQSAVHTAINLEKYLKKGDFKYNVPLAAGDVVFVPERNRTTTSSSLWGLLTGFSLVEGVARIFTGHFGD